MTYDNYLRLIGLLTLAADHRKMMQALERSACAITGDDVDGGHTADAIWGDTHDAASLLRVLGIPVPTVPPPTTTPAEVEQQMGNALRMIGRAKELFPEE